MLVLNELFCIINRMSLYADINNVITVSKLALVTKYFLITMEMSGIDLPLYLTPPPPT